MLRTGIQLFKFDILVILVDCCFFARVLDSSNDMATTHIGTPYYMSPELFSDKPYNHRVSIVAIGRM